MGQIILPPDPAPPRSPPIQRQHHPSLCPKSDLHVPLSGSSFPPEWSKVESHCPSCKQRFVTIRKEATSDIAASLRKIVIRVPRHDQVYQPSEEEMMSYLNPYEFVLCLSTLDQSNIHVSCNALLIKLPALPTAALAIFVFSFPANK